MYVDLYQVVTQAWWQKLDYAKNLQAKYFIGENILIYGSMIHWVGGGGQINLRGN